MTQSRIVNQDRIRPFITRATLLILLGACLLRMGAEWWAVAWLTVGALQTVLELVFEPAVRARHERLAHDTGVGKSTVGRRIVHVWYLNYERSITNVTGLLGAVAAVGNVLVVLLGTDGRAGPAWVRVLALTAAMLYLASGALGPLADTSMYSPVSLLSRSVAMVVRWLWVAVVAVTVAAVAGAQGEHAWGSSQPYAIMAVVAVGYYPMLRIREYERVLCAAADVAEDIAQERYSSIALQLHNLLQPVKNTMKIAAQALRDPRQRAELTGYVRDIEYTYRAARNQTLDLAVGLGMPLEDHLRSLASAERVRVRLDLRLPAGLADQESVRAKDWLLVLVQNSVQGYRTWEGDGLPVTTVTAESKGQDVILRVGDELEPVPDAVWNDPSTTLSRIRADITTLGGSMTQRPVPNGGKTITITWRAIDPLRVRTEKEVIEG